MHQYDTAAKQRFLKHCQRIFFSPWLDFLMCPQKKEDKKKKEMCDFAILMPLMSALKINTITRLALSWTSTWWVWYHWKWKLINTKWCRLFNTSTWVDTGENLFAGFFSAISILQIQMGVFGAARNEMRPGIINTIQSATGRGGRNTTNNC